MQLTEHKPGDHYFIRSVAPNQVVIATQTHTSSVIVGAHLLEPNWPVSSLDELTPEAIEPLLKHQPEVVILGVGSEQCFPPTSIYHAFLSRQVGLECMTLQAASRTFNVLMSENRRALAALILPRIQ
ncbi:MAG TPA: MTH938/NDUFAF3 family protein [Wenzhouxiangella sp.]